MRWMKESDRYFNRIHFLERTTPRISAENFRSNPNGLSCLPYWKTASAAFRRISLLMAARGERYSRKPANGYSTTTPIGSVHSCQFARCSIFRPTTFAAACVSGKLKRAEHRKNTREPRSPTSASSLKFEVLVADRRVMRHRSKAAALVASL